MMQETLITLETAVLAKEKKFDLLVRNCFTGTDPKGYDFEHETVNSPVDYNHPDNEFNGKTLYSRPTQSLLQKWLREKHHIHVEVCVEDHVEKPNYYWNLFGKFKNLKSIVCIMNSGDKGTPHHYETFEDALERALQEALNKIRDDKDSVQGLQAG